MSHFINPTNVIGCFQHRETKARFEFRATDNDWALERGFGYEVAVATQGMKCDSGYRFARLLKTVAIVLIDEGITESWPVKFEWRM